MDVARLLVEIDANTAAAEAGLASLHKQVAIAAIGFGVIGLAAIAAGALATHMAADFQSGLATLVTGAGEVAGPKGIGKVHDAILQMAQDTGTSTKQLVDGMFMIESAGFHAANGGLDILRIAAEGAKVGNADLGVTADALTTIMKDYPHVMNGAAGAMNTLIATVANGKTHMQDLAQSIATVLPTASVASIGLNDVMGAMAAMTAKGVPAANAATYLRQTILSLMAPGAAAKSMMQELGLSTDQVATEMQKNMPAALQMIIDALSKKFKPGSAQFIAALKDIAGGAKTAQGMMLLAGQGTAAFADAVKAVASQTAKGGQGVEGWNYIQKDFNVQLAKLREMLEAAFISLGEHLLPVLTNVVKFMVDNAVPAVQRLTQFWKDHQAIITIVAILIGGALAGAFVVWAVTAGAAAVATIAATWPILAIGAAIGGLIALLIYAYTNWGWFRKGVDLAVQGVGIFWNNIGNLIGILGNLLGILGRVKDAIGGVLGAVGKATGAVAGFVGSHIPKNASGTGFTSGGAFIGAEQGPELLLTPGMYTAPKGSTVLNARDTAKVLGSGGSGSSSGATYNIYPAKSQFDAAEMDKLQRRRALLGSRRGGYS